MGSNQSEVFSDFGFVLTGQNPLEHGALQLAAACREFDAR